MLKYKMLVWHKNQRLQVSRRRLVVERQQLDAAVAECTRLNNQIDLQQALAHAGGLAGMVLNRQQLLGWMRRSAADRRRSQMMRLELQLQADHREQCKGQVERCHALYLRQEKQLKRYCELFKVERKSVRVKQFNTEECELEEWLSWKK